MSEIPLSSGIGGSISTALCIDTEGPFILQNLHGAPMHIHHHGRHYRYWVQAGEVCVMYLMTGITEREGVRILGKYLLAPR